MMDVALGAMTAAMASDTNALVAAAWPPRIAVPVTGAFESKLAAKKLPMMFAVLPEFAAWPLWAIAVPMVRPALMSFIIIKFMWSWNQFLWPLIVGQDQSMFTVTVGLVYFAGQWFNDWNMITTATVLSMIPMIVIFVVLQRYLVQGLMMSGLKN